MLAIQGPPRPLCDGISRRDFLRLGSIGGLGLSLPTLLRAASVTSAKAPSHSRAKRCVLLFLTGGPPQLDTWDLKPDAPVEVRGELRPIATNVPGIRISELFPRLAQQADKYCIVRSVTHGDTVHTSAGYTMLTGVYYPRAVTAATMVRPAPDDHPHFGAILAKARAARQGMPPFVALPEIIRDAGVNDYPGFDGGFLGKSAAPFLVQADSARGTFQVPDIVLPSDMNVGRLDNRRVLLDELNQRFDTVERSGLLSDQDRFYQQAFAMLRSPAARWAFELDREPDRVREAYGKHLFGQGCLLARRLLEAGVTLVSVYWHYEGPDDSPVWDTHQNNFRHLRERLMPPTDRAVASLLADVAERGLLDDTLVVCMGEFGRSPRVNRHGGRDHWPFVQSILLAGAGIRGGSVYGSSDRSGAHPAELPVTPPDLAATILHLLGVPAELELHDRAGRPIQAYQGKPVPGLVG